MKCRIFILNLALMKKNKLNIFRIFIPKLQITEISMLYPNYETFKLIFTNLITTYLTFL